MHKDMISVIIPIYNAEAFLERCLSSVVQNTYENLQILCVDDGSTDGSPEILSRFAAADSRITVLTQANAGVSRARNLGLKHVHGEYVCFVDADDWVHREYFSSLRSAIANSGADLAVSDYFFTHTYIPEAVTASIPNVNFYALPGSAYTSTGYLASYPWGRIFRRCKLDGLFFPENISYAEDQIFNVSFFSYLQNPSIVRIDVPLYFYYQRPDSLSKVLNPDRYGSAAQWYLDHIGQFQRKDVILAHLYRVLCLYRYEGSFMGDRAQVQKKARRAFRQALPYLLKEKNISFKEKVKYLIASLSPALYRAQLLAKDPTYREVEKNWKKQKTQK